MGNIRNFILLGYVSDKIIIMIKTTLVMIIKMIAKIKQ